MAGMGPAPKPAAKRRRTNAAPGTVHLPAEGRKGAPPRWPLAGSTPPIWVELWRMPQAVAWERGQMQRVVARYALCVVASEVSAAPAALLAEVRQLEDRLGLNPMSLLRLRWEITADEVTEQRRKPPARERLRAV